MLFEVLLTKKVRKGQNRHNMQVKMQVKKKFYGLYIKIKTGPGINPSPVFKLFTSQCPNYLIWMGLLDS